MSFVGKEYKFVKQENFDGFLRAVKIPEDAIPKHLQFNPSTKLVKNGDKYTHITASPQGTKEVSFQSGVEFVDTAGGEIPTQSTFTVNGNTVIELMRTGDNVATFKREYSGDDLVVTITATGWDGTARKYYKA